MPQLVVDRHGLAHPALRWLLHDAAASRHCETAAAGQLAPNTLMQRAGDAVARLALAVAPHAGRVWVAAGPGNNGGDGLEAAALLQRTGRRVTVSLLASSALPTDAAAALGRARAAGVRLVDTPSPPEPLGRDDLAIDALFGLGLSRPPQGVAAQAIAELNSGGTPVLAIDLPSGLDGDRGRTFGGAVRAHWTLSLLTLKPGLFTAAGRDHAGEIWFDALGVQADVDHAVALLATGAPGPWPQRRHASHKGSHGDVWVVGGAAGMAGAALLAARAALAAGTGRVLLATLDPAVAALDLQHPELMHRPAGALRERDLPLEAATVVCGCGGGDAVRELLPTLLARAGRLLLDADALNALATDAALAPQLAARAGRGRETVLTPHPLEAARLLGTDAATVQADRLHAVAALATRLSATVVLKGSGSLVAEAGSLPTVVATGNAALATAGTGDVLAGWIGGLWSQGLRAGEAATLGAVGHGHAADRWRARRSVDGPLEASRLIDELRDLRA